MRDILERLSIDAGQLTISVLIQERETAACEILRLRKIIESLHAREALPKRPTLQQKPISSSRALLPYRSDALLRLRDVCELVGVGRFNEFWPILIEDAMNHSGPDFNRQATLWNFESSAG